MRVVNVDAFEERAFSLFYIGVCNLRAFSHSTKAYDVAFSRRDESLEFVKLFLDNLDTSDNIIFSAHKLNLQAMYSHAML